LQEEIQNGNFRADLYYRLNIVPLHILPLRERMTDLPLLINHFLSRFCQENQKPQMTLHENALEILNRYSWPGNVRELQNVIERLVILCPRETIEANDLSDEVVTPRPPEDPSEESSAPVEGLFEYPVAVFCKLCSTDNDLRLNQLTEWVQEGIEDYRSLVEEAEEEIVSRDSSQQVNTLKEVIQDTIKHLSDLLDLPIPKPVSITKKTLASCLVEVSEFFIVEHKGEAQAAEALGLSLSSFKQQKENAQKRLEKNAQKQPEKDCETKHPEFSELTPIPIDQVESLATRSVHNFLNLPTKGRQLDALDTRKQLHAVRLALSVLLRRLEGDHGCICMGGMTYKEIEEEIYHRATYLYRTYQDIANALSKDRGTVANKLLACHISDFPSQYTLF
jgi:hypothetical protein